VTQRQLLVVVTVDVPDRVTNEDVMDVLNFDLDLTKDMTDEDVDLSSVQWISAVDVTVRPMSDRVLPEKDAPMPYQATHVSVHDGSDAMLVSQGGATITLVNEDGYAWTDPRDQWCPILPGEEKERPC